MATTLFTTNAMPDVTARSLDDAAVGYYRDNGFVRVKSILSDDEADHFYDVALDAAQKDVHAAGFGGAIFDQHVNVWTQHEGMGALTLHPEIGRVAELLAGVPLRLWHDQILIKQPHNNAATQFHQDRPYWPHANAPNPISCWVALCDVPVERGCMTFIPGTHRRTDLAAQNLADSRSFLSLAPDLEWIERVTVPLKKGDCTFHHGYCAHMATPNLTDDPRVAHVVIFMDATATYTGARHVVTDPLHWEVGAPLDGELFPRAVY